MADSEVEQEDTDPTYGRARMPSSYARTISSTPRSRQSSPRSSISSRSNGPQIRFYGDAGQKVQWRFWQGMGAPILGVKFPRKLEPHLRRRRFKGAISILGLIAVFFLLNSWMLTRVEEEDRLPSSALLFEGEWKKFTIGKDHQRFMYSRLLALAAHALAEGIESHEPQHLWQEPFLSASAWKPCSDKRDWNVREQTTGYILVSANGGINQQRVAVCNAVAVARLLNATLVVPKFLLNSVWMDESKFGDIYQEEFFINYLKDDIKIVKELPVELQSLDLRAIGSTVTDSDIMKEAKPIFFLKRILPILLRNRVVHFVGFAHRLAFDPVPVQLQRLRCRCNFHALRFVHKIQETGALLVQRMRQHTLRQSSVDHNLLGHFAANLTRIGEKFALGESSKYLAMHLRFEIDMAAYSLCEFGGGAGEKKELEAFRAIHFSALSLLTNNTKVPSAATLRSEGLCPLIPEEAAIMLAALGFKRTTSVYLAGAYIYGGKSRMVALTSLYPNLVTKEDLLSSEEIEPFKNFSSQLAALDFIGCAAADSFAMTDPGSQLSSLVAGFRAYFGGGKLPTIRPNKRRLAGLLSKNSTIEWNEFQVRVRKAFRESEKVQGRPPGRSIYRHPRSRECMCNMG